MQTTQMRAAKDLQVGDYILWWREWLRISAYERIPRTVIVDVAGTLGLCWTCHITLFHYPGREDIALVPCDGDILFTCSREE